MAAALLAEGEEEPYTLLLGPSDCCEGVVVDFDAVAHARAPHALDHLIDETWARALANKPGLFDASKFRLAGASTAGGTATLHVGLTSYRDYVGTNRADHWRDLLGRPEAAHLSNALGCETALVTADGQLVLTRRSAQVATHGGLYNGPSGHAEPGRCSPSAAEIDAAAARRELLHDSILAEVEDEVGVPRATMSTPRLIGVMADAHLKPDLLFLSTTTLVADDVRPRHKEAVEAWESDDIVFVPRDAPDDALPPLTPVTRAVLACLRRAAVMAG